VSTTLVKAKPASMKVILLASVLVGAVVAAMCLSHSMGFLVSQFGLSWQDALAVISILTTEGAAGIAVFAPYLIPLVGTLWGLIAFIGVSAAAGW
jgi:hypothetical protein